MNDNSEIIFSIGEAATYLEVAAQTLANWRSHSKGPQYYKRNGKKVIYYKSDLDKWIKSNGGP